MNASTTDEEEGDDGNLLGLFDELPSNVEEHLYVYFSILQEDSTKKPSVCSSELSMEETLSETCEKFALHPLDFRATPCSFDDTFSSPLLQVSVEVCAHAHSTRRDLDDALHHLTKEIGNEDYDNGSIPFLGWKLFCDPIVHECEIPLKDHPTESFKAQPTRKELRLSYEEHGFVMIRNAVKEMVILNPLKRTVLEHISKVMKQIDTVKRIDPTNKIKFREVMQRDEGRFDIDLSNVPELEDFIEYVSPKGGGASWIPLVSSILGGGGGGDTNSDESPSVSSSSSSQWGINRIGVVLSTGGNKTKEQFWHADGQSHLAANQALCCFLPLIDNLTETTGYTSFWSGSHNFPQHDLLAFDVTSKMPRQTFVPGKIGFGDALLYDYKVIHRGEANRMKDGEIRPILYIVYGNADFKEENFSCQSLHDFCTDSRRHPEDDCVNDGGIIRIPRVSNINKFEIRQSEETGRCLFATERIEFRELIHSAPALVVPRDSYESHGRHTILSEYVFNCPNGDKMLAFGYGSMFNHSSKSPNVDYRLDKENAIINYYAGKHIEAGEELLIFYGNKLWFVNKNDDEESGEEGDSTSSDGGDFLFRIGI